MNTRTGICQMVFSGVGPARVAGVIMVGLVLAGCVEALAGPAPRGAATAPAGVAWQHDLQAAYRQSLQTGKPIVVVFGADWCTFCKKYETRTLAHPTMVGLLNREFIAVHLDYDKDREIAEVLEVQSVPCTVILSPEADLLGRVVGAKEPKDLWEVLQDAKELQTKVKQARIAAATGGGRS